MNNKSNKGTWGAGKENKQSADNIEQDKDSSDKDVSKKIMSMILEVFHDKEWKYTQNLQQLNKTVYLRMEKDKQPLLMDVRVTQERIGYKIQIRCCFGFRVELPATALVRCFVVEFNNRFRNYAHMNLNDDGEISIEYSYLIADPKEFNKDVFLTYFKEIMRIAPIFYSMLARLSIGVVVKEEDKLRYKTLLEQGLLAVNGLYEFNEDVTYGIDDLDSKVNEFDYDERDDDKCSGKKGSDNGSFHQRSAVNKTNEVLQKEEKSEDKPSSLSMFDDEEDEKNDSEEQTDSGGE